MRDKSISPLGAHPTAETQYYHQKTADSSSYYHSISQVLWIVLCFEGERLSLKFCPPIFSHFPHRCPFTPVEPGYGVDLYEDDYLLLLLAADLRMDPTSRPRPVSSVAFAYLGNAYNSTT
jgi:hypothetical protein